MEKVESGARSISNGLTIEPFATEHSDRLKTAVSACRVRRALTQRRAAGATGVGDLMETLADHGAGAGIPRHDRITVGIEALIAAGRTFPVMAFTGLWPFRLVQW